MEEEEEVVTPLTDAELKRMYDNLFTNRRRKKKTEEVKTTVKTEKPGRKSKAQERR